MKTKELKSKVILNEGRFPLFALPDSLIESRNRQAQQRHISIKANRQQTNKAGERENDRKYTPIETQTDTCMHACMHSSIEESSLSSRRVRTYLMWSRRHELIRSLSVFLPTICDDTNALLHKTDKQIGSVLVRISPSLHPSIQR